MNFRLILVVMLSLVSLALYGCGQGAGDAAGLNGGLTVSATATGANVTATATYTNPTQTNLIGVPITFSARVGSQILPLGTFPTNNSGSVAVAFSLTDFNGSQTVLVTASTGSLTNFATVTVTGGRTLSLTPPVVAPIFTNLSSTTTLNVVIPAQPVFATFSDPFSTTGDLSGHILNVSYTMFNTLANSLTLTTPTTTTTITDGTAPFPGTTAHMIVPPRGGVNSMIITWTVKDNGAGGTGLSATGTTTITVTH